MSEEYRCPNCGMPYEPEHLDLKRRTGYCVWCRKSAVFPKRHSQAVGNVNVPVALFQAVEFFKAGQNDNAVHLANEIVGVSEKNATALFIIAYNDAFRTAGTKNSAKLDDFFHKILPEVELEIEEEETLKNLFLYTISRLSDYECAILKKFSDYDDAKELCAFVEQFSPPLINARGDFHWFTAEMASVYAQIAHQGMIPRTTLSLLTAIRKNPESPLANGTFYQKARTERIYNDFVVKLGDIIDQIHDPDLKAKFVGAYSQVKKAYEDGMSKG